MAEVNKDYETILDDEDYAEIAENSADIPVCEKNAPTHKSEKYNDGEKLIRTAGVVGAIVFANEILIAALSENVFFLISGIICEIFFLYSFAKMLKGKTYARYIGISVLAAGIILCIIKMINSGGYGRGAAAALGACLIEGAVEAVCMFFLISDKRVNSFFEFNSRLHRLRESGRKREFLDSVGKRFK